MLDILKKWPGKSPATDGGVAHPAVYHMLDVAAVAERLVQCWDESEEIREALVLLVALHDLGKVGNAFKGMLENNIPQTNGSHWKVTEAYLFEFDEELLAPRLGGRDTRRKQLYAAAAGHHGRPPKADVGDRKRMLGDAGERAIVDAGRVIAAFCDLWPQASLAELTFGDAKALSWRLAGLATAADWIASNVAWFSPTAPGPSIEEHLENARARAVGAIEEAGLNTPCPSDGLLFDFALRPMQQACVDIDLSEGPILAILEDETGSGKTEAGLLLARRMLAAGKGRGLYFALPTMATADAMFARVSDILGRFYEGAPSLALAHGRANLSQRFRELIDARALNPDEPGPSEWLGDSRRRALLADVGVGTVDQALLAVLRAKHAPLRQFGLSSKILLVDEVHEMGDPYMGELLEELLRVHAANGGSAILLSATIPLGLRQRLSDAFNRGADRAGVVLSSKAYPALSLADQGSKAINALASPRGVVEVERLETPDAALALLIERARNGAACVWVRNAVDEAIYAVENLRARGVPADLFHARFTLHDRKRHEGSALEIFGKNREERPGRVLVATQVVESSLDLDFDVMVTDLAPMAALIQRAGRLWRHMGLRPAATRPVDGPTLYVVSPSAEDIKSEDWLEPALGRGRFVYPAALQWRSAKVLFEAGRIDAPSGLRDLIEAAHGEGIPVPEVLVSAEDKAAGKDGAAKSLALQNKIEWDAGYRQGASGAGDAEFPTRLGQEQCVLIMARREAGLLVPWSGGEWSVEACQMSEVQASAFRLKALALPDQETPEIKDIFNKLPDWMAGNRTICPLGENGEVCEGLSYLPTRGLVFGC